VAGSEVPARRRAASAGPRQAPPPRARPSASLRSPCRRKRAHQPAAQARRQHAGAPFRIAARLWSATHPARSPALPGWAALRQRLPSLGAFALTRRSR